MTQLKEMLDKFKVRYAVAWIKAATGRPLSPRFPELISSEECLIGGCFWLPRNSHSCIRQPPASCPLAALATKLRIVLLDFGHTSVTCFDRERIVIFKKERRFFPDQFFRFIGHYHQFDRDKFTEADRSVSTVNLFHWTYSR